MVDEQKVLNKVKSWVADFVAAPNPLFFGSQAPCPYARQALIDNQVAWLVSMDSDENSLKETLKLAATHVLNKDYEIAVVVNTSVNFWPVKSIDRIVTQWRDQYAPKDLYLLRDHPEDIEIVSGLKMNQGDYLLFFIQSKSKLFAAREQLKKAGYYRNWSQQEINHLMPFPSQ